MVVKPTGAESGRSWPRTWIGSLDPALRRLVRRWMWLDFARSRRRAAVAAGIPGIPGAQGALREGGLEPCEPRLLMAGDVLYAVNAGGPTLTDTDGQVWTADAGFFNPAAQSLTFSNSVTIDLTDPSVPSGADERLFQTERWDLSAGEELAYTFDVSDGTYRLDLYFAEIFSGATDPGDRVFDVEVEGQTVLDDYDVAGDVGGFAGVVQSFEVAVSDGQLDLRFLRETENPAVKAIRVVSVGDPVPAAPVVDVDGPSSSGGYLADFVAGGGAVSVVAPDATLTDADSATLASLTVSLDATPDGADEVLTADTSGTPIIAAYAGDTLSLTGSASVADYRQVLGTVAYDNTATEPTAGTRTVSFVANDGTLDSAASTAVVSVTAAPDPVAPTLDLNGAAAGTSASASFVGGGSAVAIAPAAVLDDTDSATLASLTVTLDTTPDGADETLTADVAGTGLSAAYSSQTLTVTGTASVAVYQTVLRSVAYVNTAAEVTEGTRTLSVLASDGGLTSNAAAAAVGVTRPAPPSESVVLYAVHPGAGFTDGSGQVWTPDAGFFNADAGSGTFTSGSSIDVSDASLPAGTDARHFQSERYDPSSGQELTYAFDVADGTYRIELYFADIFSGTQDPGDRVFDVEIEGQTVLDDFDIAGEVGGFTGVVKTFDVEVTDGQATVTFLRAVENPAVKAIRVSTLGPATPDPEAPVIDLNGGAAGTGSAAGFVAEDGPVPIVGPDATIVDPDSATLASLTVTLTNPLDGASETLAADTTGTGITASYANGTLTLTGVASVADYQAVLRTVTYDNAAADPDLTPRSVSFVANDGALNSAAATATVTLTDTDPPDAGTLAAVAGTVNLGDVQVGVVGRATVSLVNTAAPGAGDVTVSAINVVGADANAFGFLLPDDVTLPLTLAPGEQLDLTAYVLPSATGALDAELQVISDTATSPVSVALTAQAVTPQNVDFTAGSVTGLDAVSPTTLQWGPDGRLYVGTLDGLIHAYTLGRTGPAQYQVNASETIDLVQQIPNHNDLGQLETDVDTRLITGILIAGTAADPVVYVTSSDPRLTDGTGSSIDTNSGVISRLERVNGTWEKVDLIRGLPRSTVDHAPNGLSIDPATGELLVAVGGNTNAGAPANFFGNLPEYALSGAVLAFDLAALEALPIQTDANGQDFKYNLPTLDDQDRPGVDDNNDPFGGNNGQNQARLIEDGPYRIFATGLRNPYDVVVTQRGQVYSVDNGPNSSIGSTPVLDGDGDPTNQPSEGGVTYPDALHLLTDGSYAGHPNPTRANPDNTFNSTNPQSPVYGGYTEPGDFRPSGGGDGALATFDESTNGIAEYTATVFGNAINGDLLTVSIDGALTRLKLSPDGTSVIGREVLFSNAAGYPLDVTTVGDDHPFAGTVWVTDLFGGPGQVVRVFEPNAGGGNVGTPDDLDGDGYLNQDEIDNGTNPESAGDFPADNDADFVSDLNDPNDDNDALDDVDDPFYVDAANGTGVGLPYALTFDNDDLNRGGLLDLGFTGLMTNGSTDPLDQFDTANLTAGSAAGVLTIDQVGDGTALGSANTQENAFQFGVDVDDNSAPFVIRSQINSVFDNTTPAAGQRAGIYFGTGDQDNYISVFVEGDGTVNTVTEVGGSPTFGTGDILPPDSFTNLNLYLTVDPVAGTVQAAYSLGTAGPIVELASTEALPAAWLTGSTRPAVGVISTTGGGDSYAVTYDFIRVDFVEGDPGQTPFGGTPHAVGDVVQAEHFDEGGPGVAYADEDPFNNGTSTTRAGEGVDIEPTTDTGGGVNVGWIKAGEHLEYTFDIAEAGSYDVDFRVALADGGGGTFHLEADGVDVSGPIALPNTGGWQNWTTVTATDVDLAAGEQTLRIAFDQASSGGTSVGNLNWFRVNPLPDDPDPDPTGQTPFGGAAATVDQIIQAEHFDVGGVGVAYDDTEATNLGNSDLRPGTGVDLEATGDTGGGVNVGWIKAGEYLEYTVSIPTAGTYDLDFRVALDGGAGSTFHLESDGVDVTGPITLPDTGGWQNFETVTVNGVQLDAGTQVLRVAFDTAAGGGFVGNFNWFRVATPGIDPPDNALDLGDSNEFNWVNAAPIPGPDRFEAMTFTADNLVYVFGGYADFLSDKLNDSWVYDIREDEWTQLSDMPTTVNHLNPVYDPVLNQAWFVGGFKGEFPGDPTDDAWIYDVATDTWSAGPSMPDELSSGTTALVGRELHYVGGFPTRDQDGVTDHYVLNLDDLDAGWSTSVAAPVGRGHATVAVVGDSFYVFGGQNDHRGDPDDFNFVYAFDTITDTWSQKADMPFSWSHNEPSTFVANGRVLIGGGRNREPDGPDRETVNDFYAYDPQEDAWVRLPDLPDSLLAPFLTAVDDPNDGGSHPSSSCGCAQCQALFGGTGVTDGLNGTSETFAADFDDVWYTLDDLPADLGEVAGGVIDNKLYVVGDGDDGTYAYDFETGDWSNVNADRPDPAKDQLAQVVDGKLYVIGGVDYSRSNPAINDVQIYDPATNQWSAGADVPINVFAAQTALIGGKIYLNGGVSDGQTTDHTYVYDPAADTWTRLADAPVGRNSAATGTDGQKMYIFGGRVGGDAPGNGFDTVLVYDPATDTWESSDDPAPGSDPIAPLPQRRGGIVNAPFVAGEFYVIGGETDNDPTANDVGLYDRVDIYNPVTNTWREGAPMITARHGIYPVGYAGGIYIAGGGVVKGGSNSDVFEVYYADLI
ncbi:MAG: malectin domain-containing carbohydrate-binding protein [Planctomycetota bacterium]